MLCLYRSYFVYQVAFELYGMLTANVGSFTGEHIKPAYGGEHEAFLKKVVTPIYNVIAKVVMVFYFCFHSFIFISFFFFFNKYFINLLTLCLGSTKKQSKIKAFSMEKL